MVEIAGSAAGSYAGKLLADYGADVVRLGPARDDEDAAFYDLAKTVVEVALDELEEDGRLDEVLDRADVVIESSAPNPLAPLSLGLETPHLVKIYLSPYGLHGPHSARRSNEITDEAASGHLFLNGEPHREPISRPGHSAQHQAGVFGFIGALAALRAKDVLGKGQTVEVSHLEGLAALHQYTTVMWTQANHILQRVGNGQGGPWHPVGNYRCKDGFVALALPVAVMLQPFLEAAGLGHLMEDERFAEDWSRAEHRREFDEAIEPWLLEHTADEIITMGQGVAAPVGPVTTLHDVLEDPHLQERGFWRTLDGDSGLRLPRGPFLVNGRPPTPRCGGRESLDGLNDHWPAREPVEAIASDPVLDDGPLQGVRVLDLTRVWAGPLATRILGDLGAEVTKIEATWSRGPGEMPPEAGPRTHSFPDDEVGDEPHNRHVSFNKLNRNKRSLTLELGTAEGKALFERLVSTADVVIENFSPGVMDRLGLGFKRLQEINPSLIYTAMPGFGSSGPYRDWLAFGPLVEAACGLTDGIGYADSGPYRSGLAWPDPVTGLHAAAAVLLALAERDADPNRSARSIEVPMNESLLAFNGDLVLAAQTERGAPRRQANRHPDRAPQGCYRCRGEDRWIAISIETDAEWHALCATAGLDSHCSAFDLVQRRGAHDEIDEQITAWTTTGDPDELTTELQAAGVIAAPVADARMLVENPQLEACRFWPEVDHRCVGRRAYPALPVRFSETPATYRHGAPCLGEHNRTILAQELGLDEAAIQRLYDEGVIANRPPEGATFRGVPK